MFWLVLKSRRKYGPFIRVTATIAPRCCSGSFHSGRRGAPERERAASAGSRVYARARLVLCTWRRTDRHIGRVSSVEVALLASHTYTHADRFPVAVTEELINVAIYPLPYQKEKKREKKGERGKEGYRIEPFSDLHKVDKPRNFHLAVIAREWRDRKGGCRKRERESDHGRIDAGWRERERERHVSLGLGPPQESGARHPECRKRVWYFVSKTNRATKSNERAPWSFRADSTPASVAASSEEETMRLVFLAFLTYVVDARCKRSTGMFGRTI